MDPQAAKEYHALLWKELRPPARTADTLIWIPLLAAAAYFALDGWPGAFLGGLIGWGICAILTRIERLKRELFQIELMRHVHEHTDQAIDGKTLADIQLSVESAAKKWWQRM